MALSPIDQPFLFFPLALVVMWLASWAGLRFRMRRGPMTDDEREELNLILTSSLTLLALIIGFLTPIASVLLSAGGLLLAAHLSVPGHLLLFESGMARLEFTVMSAVLIFLGPGALSLDARLYGRREIEVNKNGS